MTTTQPPGGQLRVDSARLARRVIAARVRAERLCFESASRVEIARQLGRRTTTLRLEAAEICPRAVATLPAGVLAFTLTGFVGGRRCRAMFSLEHGLTGDAELLERAAIVADLGDTFRHPDTGASVAASVDGAPIATLLTLVRACDRVVEVEMTLPRSP